MTLFLNDYLSLSEIAKSLDYTNLTTDESMNRISWHIINYLLPGDEWLFQQCLTRLKLTHDSFVKTIFSPDVLLLSKALYLPSPSNHPPPSFLMDSKSTTILPLREFWCYEFPITFKDALMSCSLKDLISWLNFVDIVSSQREDPFNSYHLYSMLNVFLLRDDVGDYHFLEPQVSCLVYKIIGRIANHGVDLSIFNRLYPLYLELLDHYQAVSYGDAVFGKSLLFLCQTSFPVDYRLAFWSRMQLYLNLFQFESIDIFGSIGAYICPEEKNKDVLIQKSIAKKGGRLIQSDSSALWVIVQH
jgi:hypothetical protein